MIDVTEKTATIITALEIPAVLDAALALTGKGDDETESRGYLYSALRLFPTGERCELGVAKEGWRVLPRGSWRGAREMGIVL